MACGDDSSATDAATTSDARGAGDGGTLVTDGGTLDVGAVDAPAVDGASVDAANVAAVVVVEVEAGGRTSASTFVDVALTLTFHVENRGGVLAALGDVAVTGPCMVTEPLVSELESEARDSFDVLLEAQADAGEYACSVSFDTSDASVPSYGFTHALHVRVPGTPANPLELQFSDQTEVVLSGECPDSIDNPWGATFIDWNSDGHIGVGAWYHGGTYQHCAYINDGAGRMVMNAETSAVLRPDGGWGRHSATNWFAFDVYANGDAFTDLMGYGSEVSTGVALNSASAVGENFGTNTVHSRLAYMDVVLVDWDGAGELETVDDFFVLRSATDGEEIRTLYPVPDDPDFVGGRGNPGPVVGDFNSDSWPDVLLFFGDESIVVRNNAGSPEALAMDPVVQPCSARLIFATDFDLDGLLDIVCVPAGESTFHMFRNEGDFAFSAAGEIAGFGSIGGVTNKSTSAIADLDNDGYEELISFGGYNRVARESCNLVAQVRDGVFVTSGCEIYGEEGWGGWCGSPTGDAADYDNDGDIDLVGTGNSCDRYMTRLMRNDTPGVHQGINVRVRYRDGNDGCMGCRLEAHEGGERVAIKFMQMNNAFTHNRTNIVGHLGVGTRDSVDLTVVFPSGGGTHVFRDVGTNQTVFVDYAGGSPTIQEGWEPGEGF